VADAWWQVKNIAGHQVIRLGRFESLKQTDFLVIIQVTFDMAAVIQLPAFVALVLQEENIVLIKVRTAGSAGTTDRCHDIVYLPGGDEVKLISKQRFRRIQMLFKALNQ
jgi:hypothetical protein